MKQKFEQLVIHLQNMDFKNIEKRDEAEYHARLIFSILDLSQDKEFEICKETERIINDTISYYKYMNCLHKEKTIVDQIQWRIKEAIKNKKVYKGNE